MAILAPLHDIGKVGILDAVLNKPGPLTPEEYSQMRTHPHLGYNAIASAEALSLIEDEEIVGLAKDMVFTHHEWWDGHGYPRGLAGEEIPIGGRILAVVDVYDALVAPRPGEARHEITGCVPPPPAAARRWTGTGRTTSCPEPPARIHRSCRWQCPRALPRESDRTRD